MKDELDLSECYSYEEILNAVRDWTEYYNTERYQWDLARLSPVEYYQYLTTGIYPLIIPKAKGKRNLKRKSHSVLDKGYTLKRLKNSRNKV